MREFAVRMGVQAASLLCLAGQHETLTWTVRAIAFAVDSAYWVRALRR